MSTTITEAINTLLFRQQEYATAVANRFSAVRTSLQAKADKTYVDDRFTNLIGIAPTTLDTLQEIAAQILADNDSIGSLTAAIADRPTLTTVEGLIATALAGVDLSTLSGAVTSALQGVSDVNSRCNLIESTLGDQGNQIQTTSSLLSTLTTNFDDLSAVVTGNLPRLDELDIAVFGDPNDTNSVGLGQQITNLATAQDSLFQLVDSHIALLQTQGTQLALKATQTDLDGVSSRVSANEVAITALNNTKANTAWVSEQLGGKVSQNAFDTTIANLTVAKASQADLTALDNQVEALIDGISTQYQASLAVLQAISL